MQRRLGNRHTLPSLVHKINSLGGRRMHGQQAVVAHLGIQLNGHDDGLDSGHHSMPQVALHLSIDFWFSI